VADQKKKRKKSAEEIRAELNALAKPDAKPQKPPFDMKKALVRVGLVVGVMWLLAAGIGTYLSSVWPVAIAGVVTAVVAGAGVWAVRFMKRQQALGDLLRGADTEEGRKEALAKLATDYKGDVHALIARSQLEMQEEPRKALATLETIDVSKQMQAVADQVRSLRAMIHLTLGEAPEARTLVDAIDLGKQQDAKLRAMTAAVAGEAWGRTGAAKKGVEMLELFNPEDPELAEMRIQMWRARAFAYAGASDMKNASRALKKLAEANPQLLMMFVGQKKVHPLLEKEAKDLLLRSGAVPRRMVHKRV
jgi:hypothetical protein